MVSRNKSFKPLGGRVVPFQATLTTVQTELEETSGTSRLSLILQMRKNLWKGRVPEMAAGDVEPDLMIKFLVYYL